MQTKVGGSEQETQNKLKQIMRKKLYELNTKNNGKVKGKNGKGERKKIKGLNPKKYHK